MFVMLGMLSYPSRLLQVAVPGLLITAVLVLLARPLAVAASLGALGFRPRQLLFVSWAGLKGAVPIVLGTFPLLLGMRGGEALFDVVFFVVLVSALLQGWTLAPLARWLRVEDESPPPSALSLEITSLGHVNADIVQYTLAQSRPGRSVRDLELPKGAVVAMIEREQRVIPPRGSTSLRQGDNVFVVLTPEVREEVDRSFARQDAPAPGRIEFPLRGDTSVAELEEFYGVRLEGAGQRTLAEVLRERLGPRLEEGRGVSLGGVRLSVRELRDGAVVTVALRVEEPGS
jgi:cell volume regulation protein A